MTKFDPATVERMLAVKHRIADLYIGRNGVVGVGVGFKETNGRRTGQLALRFYVKRKGAAAPGALVPEVIENLPTDVIEFALAGPGDLLKAPTLPMTDPTRYLKLQGGISIAPSRLSSGSGTLGILVADTALRTPMMLSNAHILALSDGKAKKGDEICQESRADNALGWCGNCGELDRWTLGNVKVGALEIGVDAAVARISTMLRTTAMRTIVGIGAVDSRTAAAQLGAAVRKRGRTTGLTAGTIAAVGVNFEHPSGLTLNNQIEVSGDGGRRFSQTGDSGSVYVTGAGQAPTRLLALHWGSTADGRALGSPIDAVLQALAVQL